MHVVVLVEDEEQTRGYLRTLINSTEGFEVTADFADAESAKAWFKTAVEAADVRLLLSDIQLPGESGIALIAGIRQLRPDILCVVLSAYDDTDKVFKALKAGAVGYMLKGTPSAALPDALRDVVAGGSPMSAMIARKVVTAFMDVPYTDPLQGLTSREQEVLGWLAKGYAYKEIADVVCLSVETVRTHIRNMYSKLQVNNRQDAVRKAGHF